VKTPVRGPCWSTDGRWLYYWRLGVEPGRVERIPAGGGAAELIREEEGTNITAISPDGATLFVARPVQSKILGQFGTGFLEFARASPPDAPYETIARVAGARLAARVWGIALSPDGRYLATSLIDGATTNLWILPTAGGPMTPMTDFGERSVMITRNVSWSRDSQHIYAAVAEIQTDVVLLDGIDLEGIRSQESGIRAGQGMWNQA
jgi:hypothetical protein